MANEQETIADIVREMRSYINAEAFTKDYDFVSIDGLADRIEAAHKRDTGDCEACLHKHPQCADCSKLAAEECERNDLLVETERLRRALKPVLECPATIGEKLATSPNYYACFEAVLAAQKMAKEANDALCAIREAKEIMKGEAK